jgi:hypothetical protein
VQKSSERKWCRGRVLKIFVNELSETTYEVFFIDYGIIESDVTLNRIRNSQPDFNWLTDMAMHCTLSQIVPINGEWYTNVIDRFTQMVIG